MAARCQHTSIGAIGNAVSRHPHTRRRTERIIDRLPPALSFLTGRLGGSSGTTCERIAERNSGTNRL